MIRADVFLCRLDLIHGQADLMEGIREQRGHAEQVFFILLRPAAPAAGALDRQRKDRGGLSAVGCNVVGNGLGKIIRLIQLQIGSIVFLRDQIAELDRRRRHGVCVFCSILGEYIDLYKAAEVDHFVGERLPVRAIQRAGIQVVRGAACSGRRPHGKRL